MSFLEFPGMVTLLPPWAACSSAYNPFCEEISPGAQLKPPLAHLEAISSYPVPGCLGEESNTHMATT